MPGTGNLPSTTHEALASQTPTPDFRMMWHVRALSAKFASGIYWAAGGLGFLLVSWIVAPFLTDGKARSLGLKMIHLAFAGYVRVLRFFGIAECDYQGFDKLDAATGGFVLAPNHPAIWDVVFIMARIGGLTCILKSALLRNPLLTGGARMARFIPNEPPNEMVKRCVKALSEGQRLLLFPEGTRTRKREGLLNELRGGIALVAKHANVPVYPLFVTTDSDYGMKGWPAWRPPHSKVHIRMVVGEPLRCGEEESSHDFLERLRAVYIAALSAPSA